jgi:deoxyadenosine/deoxycytidine kinase
MTTEGNKGGELKEAPGAPMPVPVPAPEEHKLDPSTPSEARGSEARRILIRIDGNIGSGKSTLIKRLASKMPDLQVIPEPLESWLAIKDSNGRNILQAFYQDGKKYALAFQTFAFITRLEEVAKSYANIPPRLQDSPVLLYATERSVHSDMNIFARLAYKNGLMEELEFKLYEDIYAKWLQLFTFKTRPEITLLVDVPPKVCHARIAQRGRKEEKDIPLAYLQQIEDETRAWIKTLDNEVIVIDGTRDFAKDDAELGRIIQQIQSKVRTV